MEDKIMSSPALALVVLAHELRRGLGRLARLVREIFLVLHVLVTVEADRVARVEPLRYGVVVVEVAQVVPALAGMGPEVYGAVAR